MTVVSRHPFDTYADLLDTPRSEVFAADLRVGDIVVVSYPEGTVELLQVQQGPQEARSVPGALFLSWARLVDLDAEDSDRAAALRAQGYHVATEWPSRFYPAPENISEILGENVRR